MSYEVEKFTKPIRAEVDRCADLDSNESLAVFRAQRCASPEGQNVTATLTRDFAARCASRIFNGGWLSEDKVADIIRTEREAETTHNQTPTP